MNVEINHYVEIGKTLEGYGEVFSFYEEVIGDCDPEGLARKRRGKDERLYISNQGREKADELVGKLLEQYNYDHQRVIQNLQEALAALKDNLEQDYDTLSQDTHFVAMERVIRSAIAKANHQALVALDLQTVGLKKEELAREKFEERLARRRSLGNKGDDKFYGLRVDDWMDVKFAQVEETEEDKKMDAELVWTEREDQQAWERDLERKIVEADIRIAGGDDLFIDWERLQQEAGEQAARDAEVLTEALKVDVEILQATIAEQLLPKSTSGEPEPSPERKTRRATLEANLRRFSSNLAEAIFPSKSTGKWRDRLKRVKHGMVFALEVGGIALGLTGLLNRWPQEVAAPYLTGVINPSGAKAAGIEYQLTEEAARKLAANYYSDEELLALAKEQLPVENEQVPIQTVPFSTTTPEPVQTTDSKVETDVAEEESDSDQTIKVEIDQVEQLEANNLFEFFLNGQYENTLSTRYRRFHNMSFEEQRGYLKKVGGSITKEEWDQFEGMQEKDQGVWLEVKAKELLDNGRITWLILGLDTGDYQDRESHYGNEGRADVILVVSVDIHTGNLVVVSGNRDLRVPELKGDPINTMTWYEYDQTGQLVLRKDELPRTILEDATGIPIDTVVELNFDSTIEMIDLLFPNGLEMPMPEAHSFYAGRDETGKEWYFRADEGKDTMRMTGRDVLMYARVRKGISPLSDGDIDRDIVNNREARQRKIIKTVLDGLSNQILSNPLQSRERIEVLVKEVRKQIADMESPKRRDLRVHGLELEVPVTINEGGRQMQVIAPVPIGIDDFADQLISGLERFTRDPRQLGQFSRLAAETATDFKGLDMTGLSFGKTEPWQGKHVLSGQGGRAFNLDPENCLDYWSTLRKQVIDEIMGQQKSE